MSTPGNRSQRRPLHERSQSQNNTLAIRVVPYSPPRLEDGDVPTSASIPSSRSTSRLSPNVADVDFPAKSTFASKGEVSASLRPGSALSANSSLLESSPTTPRGPNVSDLAAPSASTSNISSDRLATNIPVINAPLYSSSHIRPVNAPSHHPQTSEPATSWTSHSLPRRRRLINIHSDKTFSLISQPPDRDLRSPPLSLSTNSVASDPFTDEQPSSSPLTTLPEHDRSFSPCSLASSPTPTATPDRRPAWLSDDLSPSTSSPWNYHMVGGLRKVPKTPNLKRDLHVTSPTSPDISLPDLSSLPTSPPTTRSPPALGSSSDSLRSASTASETTNYKVYGSSPLYNHQSRPSPSPSFDESTNYRILSQSSSPSPSLYQEPPPSSGSDENYVVHAQSSPASSSVVTVKRRTVRPEYSQESLVVPPLQPRKKRSAERLGYYRAISRESLRRAASLKSISNVLSQEAAHSVLLSSPAAVYLQGGSQAFSSILQDPRTPAATTSASSSSRPPMIAHPHQWSSQLSTVISESERGSEPGSRVGSASSHPRRSSGFPSNHSRNMLSISSSVDERSISHSRSRSDSLDRPAPSHSRYGPRDVHQITQQDEHGDGLTELYALHQRPSRTRLSGLFSGISSDRNLHSSSSSLANSFASSSLPTWARLYYGSGERRFLAPSSESMFSDYTESRPPSSFRSGSPTTEHFPAQIYSQRRRPRDVERDHHPEIASTPGPDDMLRLGGGLRKQTSSIWSPHLRHDQRASRYSIWEPPSVTWSADSGMLGRRNIQVVLFIVGFIFPFAWMAGACLPLPPDPRREMAEGDGSTSHLDVRTSSLPRRSKSFEEAQYEGAHWWRRLNRYMSIVGLLVISAVIVLIVLGVRQGWGS